MNNVTTWHVLGSRHLKDVRTLQALRHSLISLQTLSNQMSVTRVGNARHFTSDVGEFPGTAWIRKYRTHGNVDPSREHSLEAGTILTLWRRATHSRQAISILQLLVLAVCVTHAAS